VESLVDDEQAAHREAAGEQEQIEHGFLLGRIDGEQFV
jgi:hypothetical protein